MAGSPCGDPPPAVAGKRGKSTTEGLILGGGAVAAVAGMAGYVIYQFGRELSGGPRRRREWEA